MLRVKYKRCPFFEVMGKHGLDDFSYAFCLSDIAFTEAVLPGVEFSRENMIVKGSDYCDYAWTFTKKEDR